MQRSLEQEAAHNDRYLKQQQDNHLRGLGLFGNDETDAPTEDSDKDGIGLIESVPCEPDHSRAVDFVEMYGDVKAGNAACANRPPLMVDVAFRTVFIAEIGAPEASKASFTAISSSKDMPELS